LRTPPRILIVDDNPTNLEVLQVRLNAHGYELITAVDGEDALAKVREFEPDLVLLDVMMPKLDGISVVKQLKADSDLRTVPVVMLTSSREEQDLLSSYNFGVNAYVVKPVDFADFVQALNKLGLFWAVINQPPPGSVPRVG